MVLLISIIPVVVLAKIHRFENEFKMSLIVNNLLSTGQSDIILLNPNLMLRIT